MVGAAATAAVLAINSPLANPASLLQKASGASIRPEAFSFGQRLIVTRELTEGEYLLSKEGLIPAEGLVVDKQPNAFFKVRIKNSEHIVLAQISGKVPRNRIRILVGDCISVEMSPYDLSKGRITYRYK